VIAWPGALLRGDAAVDHEAGTGHEAGIVRGKKDDALGDVGNRPHAADRDAVQRLLAGRFKVVCAEIAGAYRKDLIAHIGVDRPRMHRVDQCQVDYTPSVVAGGGKPLCGVDQAGIAPAPQPIESPRSDPPEWAGCGAQPSQSEKSPPF
jgi:hypothetical protein